MPRYVVTIEGPGFKDLQVIELPRLPNVGDPLETRFGTTIVTEAEALAGNDQYTGRITCRLP
jgi:hypothetical protein